MDRMCNCDPNVDWKRYEIMTLEKFVNVYYTKEQLKK
jgi:hypothetical protein